MARAAARARSLILLFCFAVFLQFTPTTAAQDSATGAIRGTVEDAARVLVTETAKGLARATVTNEEGGFSMLLLAPGEYTVWVEAPAMAPLERAARVEVGDTVELTLRLRLPAAHQTVDVAAEAGMIAVETSAIATVINQEEISDLPSAPPGRQNAETDNRLLLFHFDLLTSNGA